MKAFSFLARAHQAFSDEETISNDGSQSMGDCGNQPKIPQVQFLEPNNNQTSAQPFPEYQYCWESGGKATIRATGSWKSSVSRPHWELHPHHRAWHYGRNISMDAEDRRGEERHNRNPERSSVPQGDAWILMVLCTTRHTSAFLKECVSINLKYTTFL